MPKAAILILLTSALDLAVSSMVIGASVFVVLQRRKFHPDRRLLVGALAAVFALLDLMWWPAAIVSSASFTLHDPELAEFFGIAKDTPVGSYVGVGLGDLLLWFARAGIALWVLHRLEVRAAEPIGGSAG